MLILYLSLNWDNCSNFISFGWKMWLYWFCRCALSLQRSINSWKSHVGWLKWQLDTILKQKTLGAIQTKLGKIWSSGFRGDLWNSLWCKTNSWWLTSSNGLWSGALKNMLKIQTNMTNDKLHLFDCLLMLHSCVKSLSIVRYSSSKRKTQNSAQFFI